MGAERRRCHRLNIELAATFKADDTQSHISIGTTLNISAIGIRFSTRERMRIGQEVLLNVTLPDKKEVAICADIIWIRETRVYKAREYTVGLKIKDDMKHDEAVFVKYFADEFREFFGKEENKEDEGQENE